MESETRALRHDLEHGRVAASDVIEELRRRGNDSPHWAGRIDAYELAGDIAGRAFGAPWEVAERAAWILLDATRHIETKFERARLLHAMGRAFRNAWLLPYVHSRIDDADESIACAAITAAGGLGFPALEENVAARLDDAEASVAVRLAAIHALGRMGAVSAASRLASRIEEDDEIAAAALTALTEIRSDAGVARTIARLDGTPSRELAIAGARYLAELGRAEVMPVLRRFAREGDPELRIVASLASRALKAEMHRDAAERILVALTENDRAVRSSLARRLRTLPVGDVLREAEVLFGDDPEGVLQVVAEVRAPEVTRFLLGVSARTELPILVRARAVGDVEANEAWERDALAEVAVSEVDVAIRAAAARALGAFATTRDVLGKLRALASAKEPALRGAFLWALQLAARPRHLEENDARGCEAVLRTALHDDDAVVRRRAAYVAGNLGLAPLADEIVRLAQTAGTQADLRVAAFVALGDLAAPVKTDEMAGLFVRESDTQVLGAASRALALIAIAHPSTRASIDKASPRLAALLRSDDAVQRAAAVRLAGVLRGSVKLDALAALASDAAPRVREQLFIAFGRLADPAAIGVLNEGLEDADVAMRERAAEALLEIRDVRAFESVIGFCAGEDDAEVRARIAERVAIPSEHAEALLPRLNRALGALDAGDPAYEPLLEQKLRIVESMHTSTDAPAPAAVDDAIVTAFPTFARLARVRGFEPLGRSLRTAEALYRASPSMAESDLTPPIVLWMKSMEGYVHAWLSPRLQSLQQDSRTLYEVVDRMLGNAWGEYQRHLASRWTDAVTMGGLSVEVPLRGLANALREFHDRRGKRLDSPLSITEWARLMVFLAVDHPSGARNLLKVSSKDGDTVIRIAHRLHALAAVRNAVTHRTVEDAPTLEAFRKGYYASFEDLTHLA